MKRHITNHLGGYTLGGGVVLLLGLYLFHVLRRRFKNFIRAILFSDVFKDLARAQMDFAFLYLSCKILPSELPETVL